MERPHAAALAEDVFNEWVASTLTRRGWQHKIIPYTGYGAAGFVRVLGRIVHTRRPFTSAAADAQATPRELRSADDEARGWKAFVTAPAMSTAYTVVIGDREITARTDRSGIIDLTVSGHGLSPGWHRVTIRSSRAMQTEAGVLVIGATQRFGIVSDIDDTVLSTMLPRPVTAFWNTFVRQEQERRAVPGMAGLLRELVKEHNAPVIYLSTGAWNTAPHLTRFLRRHSFPAGPLLLTDWGPTNTGWFRSGIEHKRSALARLARELPQVRWVLIGDDGQNDPQVYGEFAANHPELVRAVALRELSIAEKVVTHGMPPLTESRAIRARGLPPVPFVQGADGYVLARVLRQALARDVDPASRPLPVFDPEPAPDPDSW